MSDLKGKVGCPACGRKAKILIQKMTTAWHNINVTCECGYSFSGETWEENTKEYIPVIPDEQII